MELLWKYISIWILAAVMMDTVDPPCPPFKGRWENPYTFVKKDFENLGPVVVRGLKRVHCFVTRPSDLVWDMSGCCLHAVFADHSNRVIREREVLECLLATNPRRKRKLLKPGHPAREVARKIVWKTAESAQDHDFYMAAPIGWLGSLFFFKGK